MPTTLRMREVENVVVVVDVDVVVVLNRLFKPNELSQLLQSHDERPVFTSCEA